LPRFAQEKCGKNCGMKKKIKFFFDFLLILLDFFATSFLFLDKHFLAYYDILCPKMRFFITAPRG